MKLDNFKTEWKPIHTLMLISLTIMAIGYIVLNILFQN